MATNPRNFQESITRELDIIKNRVRDLIDDRHWGEEGRYKEAILKNILKKFLPQNISVGTGFIINTSNQNRISRQLDIIIYDNNYPVLFSEGDFIITTKENVKGIIEVKSRITTGTLEKVISQFDSSINMLSPFLRPSRLFSIAQRRQVEIRSQVQTKIFLGIFAFEYKGAIGSNRIANTLRESERLVNHLCLGSEIFIRKWKREDGKILSPRVNTNHDFYNIYELNNLSFSYFISNLIDIVTGGLNDRYWFSFPIENTKEAHRVRTVKLT